MLYFRNKKLEFNADRCTACSVCIGVCESKALSFVVLSDSVTINIDYNKCKNCGTCVRICPSKNFVKNKLSNEYFTNVRDVEICYACDTIVRYKSSSGGCTRVIAYNALKTGLADYVYTLNSSFDPSGIYYNRDNASEILLTVNSQYRPVLFGAGIQKNFIDKKILVIGTPCQIKAVNEYYTIKKFRNVYYIALLCKQQKNNQYSEFLNRQFSIDKSPVFFRGNGWPGQTGNQNKHIPYSRAAGLAFGKKLWSVPGCKYCGDCIGMHCADLTMADPWSLEEYSDSIGKNLVFVWNAKGDELISNSGANLNRCKIEKSKALHSIDWNGYLLKLKHIDFYNNIFNNRFECFRFKTHLLLTRLLEKFLIKFKIPSIVLRLIAKF